MYRCESCHNSSKHHEPQHKVFTYREDKSILKEVHVCTLCFTGKPFVREIEVSKLRGFHKVMDAHHNDRVQI